VFEALLALLLSEKLGEQVKEVAPRDARVTAIREQLVAKIGTNGTNGES
jgi:hypothetical protein